MKIKASGPSFVIFTFPLFVYGQVSIQDDGNAVDDSSYKLECSISPFTTTATWAKDGITLTTCTSTFCNKYNEGVYAFSTDASGITVVMNPVSISVDGVWKCTSSSGPFVEFNVTSSRSTTTTPTTITTTKPSKSPNKCLYFIEAKSCDKIYIGFGIIMFCILVVFPTVGGVICWKRNHKKTSSKKEQPSDPDPRKTKIKTGNMEMQ